MSLSLHQQLDAIWDSPQTPLLPTLDRRYFILSDLHMGNRGRADDFRHNEKLVIHALEQYREKGFSLILLGDVEEFWQFSLDSIRRHYEKTVYRAIRDYPEDQVYRIIGNHDIDWQIKFKLDPIRIGRGESRPPLEGLKLADGQGIPRILLCHGHQGTVDSDHLTWFTRPAVWLYGRIIEPLFDFDAPPSATLSMIPDDFERERHEWAQKNERIFICGHSHRAIFASKSWAQIVEGDIFRLKADLRDAPAGPNKTSLEHTLKLKEAALAQEKEMKRDIVPMGPNPKPCYFNSGCALYQSGITGIEIADNSIRLVKWEYGADKQPLYDVYGQDTLEKLVGEILG